MGSKIMPCVEFSTRDLMSRGFNLPEEVPRKRVERPGQAGSALWPENDHKKDPTSSSGHAAK